MDKLNLDTNEFPLTTNALAFMQASYSMLEKLAALGGDNYIVSGCEKNGNHVSSGYLVLKGILMPFTGGQIPVHGFVTYEEIDTKQHADIAFRIETTYRAKFGENTDPDKNIKWTDIASQSSLQKKVDKEAGKRLITNKESTKLAEINEKANNYSHPDKHPISMIEGLEEALAAIPVDDVVYEARIFETSKYVNNSSKKKEFVNKDFISSISTIDKTYRLIFSKSDSAWLNKHTVQITANTLQARATRTPSVELLSGGSGIDINLRDRGADAQLSPFWIIIRKKA